MIRKEKGEDLVVSPRKAKVSTEDEEVFCDVGSASVVALVGRRTGRGWFGRLSEDKMEVILSKSFKVSGGGTFGAKINNSDNTLIVGVVLEGGKDGRFDSIPITERAS